MAGNGNLTKDLNKSITNIYYNHLNLVRLVMFANGNSVEYVYDALGKGEDEEEEPWWKSVIKEEKNTEEALAMLLKYIQTQHPTFIKADFSNVSGDGLFVYNLNPI
jgi:hypothetical protein